MALCGVIDAAGQHHVHHAGNADQARNPHRAATAAENAALAFGQGIKAGRFGDPHMGGSRQLKATSDHPTMPPRRSEQRREGAECVSTCRSRWTRQPSTTKTKQKK